MRTPASHRSRRVLTAGLLAVALGGGLTACGGEDESNDLPAGLPAPTATTETATTPTETTATETTPTEAPTTEAVEVAADPDGQLAYVQKTLEVPAGKVTFAFANESPVPHDFVIEGDGEDLAKTEVISESEENLEAELDAGEYTYYCSVPGHRQAGMEGTLTAK